MLVKLVGKKNEEKIVVSSRDVADTFEKEHKHVLDSIRQILAAENSATKFFIENMYEVRGRKYPEYLMDRDGFSLLVMGFTGDKAMKWKIQYIEAFNNMEAALKKIQEERHEKAVERAKGVVIRHILTDTIRDRIADSPNKKFMYPNLTKLIYKHLFGMNMKEINERLNLRGKDNVRDHLTADGLMELQQKEMLVSSLLNEGFTYADIKKFLEEHCKQEYIELVPPRIAY